MGFYTDSLEAYRQTEQTGMDITTRLQGAKKLVDQKYADRVQELVDQNKILQNMNPYGRGIDYSMYDAIKFAQREFENVTFQTPEEFFAGAASLEEMGLKNYISNCQGDYTRTVTKLEKLEVGGGFLGRLSRAIGFNQSAEARLATKLGKQTRAIDDASDALADWNKLSFEDKIEYELCKFENGQSLGFDSKALREYGAMNTEMQGVQIDATPQP